MLNKIKIIVVALLFPLSVFAQTAAKADALFGEADYAAASAAYASLLQRAPDNQLYLYRYARCQQELGQTDTAIVYFEKAGEKYALRNYHLGLLYEKTYRFEQAATLLSRYVLSIADDSLRRDELQRHIDYCRKGARYLRRVEDVSIVDSVTLPKERLLDAYRLSAECGTISLTPMPQTETVADSSALSASDNVLLFPCYITQKGDHRICVQQADSLQRLVSCHRIQLSDECDTLPAPVNGLYNQSYPYMLTDGVTLYFASDRAEGLGGYDIYVTRYNHSTQEWYEPENLGFPFNSQANDYMYAEDETAGIGYFATDRFAGEGFVTVYSFLLNDHKRIVSDTIRARQLAQLVIKPHTALVSDSAANTGSHTTESALASDSGVYSSHGNKAEEMFVITDSLVYHSPEQFRSAKARELYGQLLALDRAIGDERQHLSQAREQYAASAQNEELQSVILASEHTLLNMLNRRQQLVLQIRKEELDR